MIHVVTAVHNRYNITEKFVKQLNNQSHTDIHLILVDDGSTDYTVEMVKKYMPSATIIKGIGNLWWGGALHKAYQWIVANCKNDEDFVLISNDDVEFADDYIQKGINCVTKCDNTLVSGIGIGNLTHEVIDLPIIWDFGKSKGYKITNIEDSGNCVSTRSLFCRIRDVKKIGGFHPVLLPHYASDYEWTMRAARKGYAIRAFDNLTYTVREDTTGLRERKEMTFKQLMSKKSNANPLYRISFILLSTPYKYLLSALIAQFRRAFTKN